MGIFTKEESYFILGRIKASIRIKEGIKMASDYEHLKLGALALVHTGNLDNKTHSVLVNLINFLFEELLHRKIQTRDSGGFSTEISVKNKPPQNEDIAESIDSNDGGVSKE